MHVVMNVIVNVWAIQTLDAVLEMNWISGQSRFCLNWQTCFAVHLEIDCLVNPDSVWHDFMDGVLV